ncbi:MAG: drug/metabolite transporter (DMT)-like permease [Planctomycetota bacterium]|jgi:drug/metabolite transporter (DMT)-like permease
MRRPIRAPGAIALPNPTPKQRPALGAVLALLSAILFGVSTPIAKVLLDSVPPFTLAGLFYLGAALLLLPAVVLGGRNTSEVRELDLNSASGKTVAPGQGEPARSGISAFGLPKDAKNLRYLGGAVLFGGVLGPLALLFGLRLATASSVSMLLNLETVATALLGVLLFKEHLGRWTVVANLGVLVAGVLLSLEGGTPGLLGGLLVAAAALAWGFDNHFTALIDGIRPAESTFWKGLVAGTVNLSIGLATSEELDLAPKVWLAALAVGGLSYGLSITLYVSSAQRLGAVRAQMIFAAAPVFGVLGAVLYLDEPFTAIQAVAALLIAGAIWMLFQDDHGHAHQHTAVTHTHAHRHDDDHHAHTHEGVAPGQNHTHRHSHEPVSHDHAHWPDLHHRHEHGEQHEKQHET